MGFDRLNARTLNPLLIVVYADNLPIKYNKAVFTEETMQHLIHFHAGQVPELVSGAGQTAGGGASGWLYAAHSGLSNVERNLCWRVTSGLET